MSPKHQFAQASESRLKMDCLFAKVAEWGEVSSPAVIGASKVFDSLSFWSNCKVMIVSLQRAEADGAVQSIGWTCITSRSGGGLSFDESEMTWEVCATVWYAW